MEGRGRQELPEGEQEQAQPWKVLYITLVGARSLAHILLAMFLALVLQGLCMGGSVVVGREEGQPCF